MLQIRSNIFETNSSSSDYYKEPDWDNDFAVKVPVDMKLTFVDNKHYFDLIKYMVDLDYNDILIYAFDSWLSYYSNMHIVKTNGNALLTSYNAIANIHVEGKRGFKDSTSILNVSYIPDPKTCDADVLSKINEAWTNFMNELQEFIRHNIDDVCDSYNFEKDELLEWCDWNYADKRHPDFYIESMYCETLDDDDIYEYGEPI